MMSLLGLILGQDFKTDKFDMLPKKRNLPKLTKNNLFFKEKDKAPVERR